MIKRISFYLIFSISILNANAQASNYDLIIARSSNGINWSNNSLFESSSGVPSLVQHSTGVIYSAFQWFPAPQNQGNPSFDKVAIKKSLDGGFTWSQPTLAVFNGYPSGYKRPFDPTLVIADNGNIRMYFSGSKTGTLIALDSTVHMYSAISSDGVNYNWEPGVRIMVKDSVIIDPAVIKMGNKWHYTCPKGAPQHGARHWLSDDGLVWTATNTIASDNNHNWTGNLMMDDAIMKFYGTPNPQSGIVWSKSTSDGFSWTSYQNCTGIFTSNGIQADPSVIKTGANNYLMVYVSTYSTAVGLEEQSNKALNFNIYPNPSKDCFSVSLTGADQIFAVVIYDALGQEVLRVNKDFSQIKHSFLKGIYFVHVIGDKVFPVKKIIVQD